jgi:CheY-like chemotaxis protein
MTAGGIDSNLPSPADGKLGMSASRPRVLVVDDARDMRELLREVLEVAGYEVESVGSGARAISLMRQRTPDLVISDLLMPGMTGFSLRARTLRDPALAKVPVIVLSAYWGRPGETLEAMAVLAKPLNIDLLLATVERLLGPFPGRN